MKVGKTYKFDAAHFLPGHPKCGALHGHTYHLTVMLWGQPDSKGMVIDFGELDIVVKKLLEDFDHKFLNNVLTNASTCENLAIMLQECIQTRLKLEKESFVTVRLQEGDGGWAEV